MMIKNICTMGLLTMLLILGIYTPAIADTEVIYGCVSNGRPGNRE